MGYPMTWRRLLGRSHFNEGTYESLPYEWQDYTGFTAWDLVAEHHPTVEGLLDHGRAVEKSNQERVEANNRRLMLFCGDLRRLERDTLDEGYICQEIARRTGAEPDMVAAVLKEWLAV